MSNDPQELETFEAVLQQRFGRRGALKAALAGVAGAATATAVTQTAGAAGPYAPGELAFDAVPPNGDDQITVPAGFTYDVLLSWGDPIFPGVPAFDPTSQSEADQNLRAGFNHDYVDFRPLPAWNSTSSTSGLLWVNHEYTDTQMIFQTPSFSLNEVDVELAAHGGSLVKIDRAPDGSWSKDLASTYNRRITGKTPMTLTGPVAGTSYVQTSADPAGTTVLGMLNNCGGGNTPWGTILTCEENFDQYFGNAGTNNANVTDPYVVSAATGGVTMGAGASSRKWETQYSRFDLAVEPREYLRFGWVVEIDPYDPNSTPKKRTALGRFKHEAAAGTVSPGGKFVSYSGDDQVNWYIYKFVTAGTVDTDNRAANMDLLDDGTLYVAKFNADGTGEWLPLTFGVGPLVAPAFADQADVCIRARQAGTALGATKMARPEDVEVNPATGKVYAVMTGDKSGVVNAANPRATGGSSIVGNSLGHIIEITETGGDHAATTFTWEILVLCGMPNATGSVSVDSSPAVLSTATADNITFWAGYDESLVSPIARVDNVSFDHHGFMYISTDGQPSALAGGSPVTAWNDVLAGFSVEGTERGHGKNLMTAVKGCEVTGPFFTPDDCSLFLSIQHPGIDMYAWTAIGTAPSYSMRGWTNPGSAWNTIAAPGSPGIPRPATIVVRRTDGSPIPTGPEDPGTPVPELPMPALAVGAAAVVGGLVAFRHQRMSGGTAEA